jgi:Uma2 family endonuclease
MTVHMDHAGASSGLLTADEFMRLPDRGRTLELVRGRVVELVPPGFEHGAVLGNVLFLLSLHVRNGDLGVVTGGDAGHLLARDPDTIRGPDVAFVARERIPAAGLPTSYWPGAPDLAVEIVSPHDAFSHIEQKTREYLDAGAREVWIVDPRLRQVRVSSADGAIRIVRAGETLRTDVLPGFAIELEPLFSV